MTKTEILDLISELRAKGVLSFSHDGFSVVLGPAPVHDAELTTPEAAVKLEPKLGKDGLSEEEQQELYNRSFTDVRS